MQWIQTRRRTARAGRWPARRCGVGVPPAPSDMRCGQPHRSGERAAFPARPPECERGLVPRTPAEGAGNEGTEPHHSVSLHRHAHRPSGSASPVGNGRGVLLVVLLIAQLMVILDITAVNIALPSLARDLQLSGSDISWTITSYSLIFGSLLLFGGRAADLLGRRRMFLTGLGDLHAHRRSRRPWPARRPPCSQPAQARASVRRCSRPQRSRSS